jgi:ATP-dependent RNA helicase SUPV3L1/SUV3
MRDGTFGTTAECPPLDDELARAVEGHSFESLTELCWRNSDLDFASVDLLLASLTAAPARPGLMRGNDATDLQTLMALAREADIRRTAVGRHRVRLLWDACQIPDFRKLADDTHTRLCARVFGHIVEGGRLPTDWLAGQIAALSRADGDIDTLMQRLAGVRVWTYIAARADWVPDAAHWQARAREVEDLLSDALHERLIARFVDRRAAHLMRRLDSSESTELLSAVTRRGEVVVEGHPVGHVSGFAFAPDPATEGDERKLVLRAARRALREEMPRRVARLEAEPDTAFSLAPTQRIAWDGVAVARLRPGPGAVRPLVDVIDSEFLDGRERERVRARLQRFVDAEIQDALAPLFAAVAKAEGDQDLRGHLHRLTEGLGVASGATEADIPPVPRGKLKALGARAGRFALFMPALLKPRAAALRALLWSLRHNDNLPMPALPAPGLISMAPPAGWPSGFAAAIGWVEAGPMLIRLDVAERVVAELAWASRFRPIAVPADLASRLSIRAEILPAVLRGLGLRLLPAATLDASMFGPPAPPRLMLARRHRAEPPPPQPAARAGPFAALAVLRR